jgi:signal transduction histidine kinase
METPKDREERHADVPDDGPKAGAATLRKVLKTVLVPHQSYLDSLKTYVGFTDESSAILRTVYPVVAPHVATIIDDFYATIEAHPGAQKAITGGVVQIERLKHTLRRWLEELFLGPHDEAYLERRARIGRVHVRIELPQAYMFTAMNRIRVRSAEALRSGQHSMAYSFEDSLLAMHQIMDIELAIMLETYREDLVAKNRNAERLATIGQFAAGIGHELRNPLGVVESSAFLLRQHLGKAADGTGEKRALDPKVERHLDKINAEVKRANKTINDLLELARNRPPRPQKTALSGVVDGAVAAALLPATVEVVTSVAPGVMANLDADQVICVVSNLLLNASQAMDERGRIWLEGESNEIETRIRVRDSGPGVPSDLRHRIFEALFTTKAKGSGLGLALCRRIAEAHGGTIVLEPRDGGASFLLTIPKQPFEAA